jgi:hypothetical protein
MPEWFYKDIPIKTKKMYLIWTFFKDLKLLIISNSNVFGLQTEIE